MKYVLFGAGDYGHKAVQYLGKEMVAFFVDNFSNGKTIDGIEVKSFSRDELQEELIAITVSPQYESEIAEQLSKNGLRYITFNELMQEATKRRIMSRPNYLSGYANAIKWIYRNSVPGEGIIVSTGERNSYPEVTGYFIPTLLQWGHRDLALSYAKWLLKKQNKDGSWNDATDKTPYIFDSAQIIKGLLAIRTLLPEADNAIQRGCEWILSCMTEEGQLVTPSKNAWGSNSKICDEKIHIYCISPIIEAGIVMDNPEYVLKARRIWDYYKNRYYEEIITFSMLSHFYAYVIEALLDLGENEMAQIAMSNMEKFQKESGAIPAYNDADWVCSTGILQFALIWYRMGDFSRANSAFKYAMLLQNQSGGWFGSYQSENSCEDEISYFPSEEISWAIKFYLDALYYKNKAEFERLSDTFLPEIDRDDDRYKILLNEIGEIENECSCVLDVGCGKGRYIRKLKEDLPQNNYFAVDLSASVLKDLIDLNVARAQGSMTNIPYDNDEFDCTYSCEALEHAIDIKSAIGEMCRVTKTNGKVIIVDKNKEQLGKLDIGEWEQWFDALEVKEILDCFCSNVKVYKDISYEHKMADGLFLIWVGTVR